MIVTTEWHGDQFNVAVASKEGVDPFLTVKGCRIANGKDGEFVSWPSTKNAQSGKWWQHVWASERFAAVVLSTANENRPRTAARNSRAPQEDDGDPIPF